MAEGAATAMLAIDADALAATLDPAWLVERLRQGHMAAPAAVEQLLLSEPRPDGDSDHFLIWAAWAPGAGLASKLVTVFPDNERRGVGPNIRSVVVLFDGGGRPRAVVTGESFTRMKTAADSALAARLLSRPEAEVLAVLGAGAQAETQVRFLAAVRPGLRRILLWNRTPEKAAALAGRCRALGLDAVATADAEAAVGAADIVTCVTAARSPVLRGAWLKPGAHVDLVGAFTPEMRESDDAVVRRGRIFVDTRRFALLSGDLSQPFKTGVAGEAAIAADLFELCSGRKDGRRSPEEITVFKNGGGGHLDLMVAEALYATAATGRL